MGATVYHSTEWSSQTSFIHVIMWQQVEILKNHVHLEGLDKIS